jgi:hypothetical protein
MYGNIKHDMDKTAPRIRVLRVWVLGRPQIKGAQKIPALKWPGNKKAFTILMKTGSSNLG